jgi:hypothetical protein
MITRSALSATLASLIAAAVSPPASAGNVTNECEPVASYDQAIGTRALDDSERGRIKGTARHSGNVLYVDLYNGNRDITLTAVNIRVIPDTPKPASAVQTGAPCNPVTGSYDRHLHRLTVMLPPKTATQQRFRVPDVQPGGRFTWEIAYAEGHDTPTSYPWYLWR